MSAKGTCTQTERLLRVAAHFWGGGGLWAWWCGLWCFVACFVLCFVLWCV
nr:MAG TPA: hypothetical protein [Caudoviricetes sp.]